MKKIILLTLSVMMVGCDWNSNYKVAQKDGYLFGVIEIDSCEYIRGSSRLAHKGNCRFCEERDSIKWEKRRKEIKELVEQLKNK